VNNGTLYAVGMTTNKKNHAYLPQAASRAEGTIFLCNLRFFTVKYFFVPHALPPWVLTCILFCRLLNSKYDNAIVSISLEQSTGYIQLF
jgi:hypothetical protein